MSRLDDLKDEVAKKYGWSNWKEMHHYKPLELPIDELALEYAHEMVKHNLERAAKEAKVLVSNGESIVDVRSWTLDDGIRFSPDYRRIINTEIELI